jgi:hypothetical protein
MTILLTHLLLTSLLIYILYRSTGKNIYATVIVTILIMGLSYDKITTRLPSRMACYYGINRTLVNEESKGFEITKIYNKDLSKNILVTSLYGNDPKYYRNIDATLKTIKTFGDDWQYRIYLHDKVKPKIRDSLVSKGIQVYIVSDPLAIGGMNSAGMFWRFMPLQEDIRFIIIDADDVFDDESMKTTLRKWKRSRKPFMRHVLPMILFPKYHVSGCILGGVGCGSLGCGKDLQTYHSRSPFGSDEIYLNTTLMKYIKEHGCISFLNSLTTVCHLFRHPLFKSQEQNEVKEYIPVLFNKL